MGSPPCQTKATGRWAGTPVDREDRARGGRERDGAIGGDRDGGEVGRTDGEADGVVGLGADGVFARSEQVAADQGEPTVGGGQAGDARGAPGFDGFGVVILGEARRAKQEDKKQVARKHGSK